MSGADVLLTNSETRIVRASTRKLRGAPVYNLKGAFSLNKMDFPFAISGCLCVQDSPENPCPCTNVVMWLSERPLSAKATGKKNDAGREIVEFTLARDAAVVLDLQVTVKLKSLERLVARAKKAKTLTVVRVPPPDELGTQPDRPANRQGTTSAPELDWADFAFNIGYAIGTVLDDLGGSNEGGNDNLSDDLADWLAENLPAPDWLKDIF